MIVYVPLAKVNVFVVKVTVGVYLYIVTRTVVVVVAPSTAAAGLMAIGADVLIKATNTATRSEAETSIVPMRLRWPFGDSNVSRLITTIST